MSTYVSQAVLLVDGYNIIGLWPRLREKRDRDELETARRELIEVLVNYSAVQDFEARLVFDAHYRDTPGVKEIITKNLSVHYTDFGQTADTYIEKSCASLRYELRSVKGKRPHDCRHLRPSATIDRSRLRCRMDVRRTTSG
jgi:predicted RNA-binding protein with PIN domain